MLRKNFYFFILLPAALCCFTFCKTTQKTQTQPLSIKASGTATNPITIGVSDFFTNEISQNFIDQPNTELNYRFVPGGTALLLRDTSVTLFYPDTVLLTNENKKTKLQLSNPRNTQLNLFFDDLGEILFPFRYAARQYFAGKEDSIAMDQNYIDNYLAKNERSIRENTINLCRKYAFDSTLTAAAFDYLNIYKLAYAYEVCEDAFPRIDSMGKLMERQLYYIRQLNMLKATIFSLTRFSSLTEHIANKAMNQSIRYIKTDDALTDYYGLLRHTFPRNGIAYDFLISSLEIQATKNHLKLQGLSIEAYNSDIRNSFFKKYVDPKNSPLSHELKDLKKDMNLYDPSLHATDLSKLTAKFTNKPFLIDFWASWCGPCIEKMPETVSYKNKIANLNIVFISLDKSQDSWKEFLHNHDDLNGFTQYRRNFNNQDKIFSLFTTIPKYGLLQKDGRIELLDEVSESILKNYCAKF